MGPATSGWAVFGLLAAFTATLVAGCSSDTSGTAGGACASPTTTLSASRAAPGDTLTVSTQYLQSGCDDTGGAPTAQPVRQAPVVFQQGDRKVELGKADASGADASLSVRVTVPADATAGPAVVYVGKAAQAQLTVAGP